LEKKEGCFAPACGRGEGKLWVSEDGGKTTDRLIGEKKRVLNYLFCLFERGKKKGLGGTYILRKNKNPENTRLLEKKVGSLSRTRGVISEASQLRKN